MAVFPEPHELSAYTILEEYFSQSITIIEPSNAYKRRTPDFLVGTIEWELKSPTTKSLVTLEHRLRDASRQSRRIVMDLRRINIEEPKVLRALERFVHVHKRIKRLICITKAGSVVVIK